MSFDRDYQVSVKCLDNGNTMDADVLSFVEGKFLTVSLNTIRVNLQYNNSKKCYIGSAAGLEFQAFSPNLERR